MMSIISFFWFILAFSHAAPMPHVRQANASNLIYITLEEHYDPPAMSPFETDPVQQLLVAALGPEVEQRVTSVDAARIENLDKNNIRIQVIANDPTPEVLTNTTAIRQANNQIAKAVSQFPNRLRGFCFLPMAHPVAAAAELNRSVTELGLLGALVDNHLLNETFYDSNRFDPLWRMAVALDVPIYLHPTYPTIEDVNSTLGRFKPEGGDWKPPIAATLGTSGFGWHVDTGLTFLRLWLGGVFDRFPKLKIVLGHMGETIPYMLDRADYSMSWAKPKGVTVLEAYANNVWVTTSGFFSLHPFRTLHSITAADRILYSVDYPWAYNENGTAFMESLRTSGIVSQAEWEAIAFRNAEKLLNLS